MAKESNTIVPAKPQDWSFLDDEARKLVVWPDRNIDMHVHSMYSDGLRPPAELVKLYHENGYDLIAVTDHDGVDGVPEAQKAGAALGMTVLTGIEFGTLFRGKIEFHLLGYDFDLEDPGLRKELEEIRAYRIRRNEKLMAYFRGKGYDISFDDMIRYSGQDYIGKPNFARALIRKGYCKSVKEAFDSGELLGSPEAMALKKKPVPTRDAIRWIRSAGGIPVLAHPMETVGIGPAGSRVFFENLDRILGELVSDGLQGVECFHPSATEAESLRLTRLAARYHLRITRGSDYHGF